jgi:hypothetical protein
MAQDDSGRQWPQKERNGTRTVRPKGRLLSTSTEYESIRQSLFTLVSSRNSAEPQVELRREKAWQVPRLPRQSGASKHQTNTVLRTTTHHLTSSPCPQRLGSRAYLCECLHRNLPISWSDSKAQRHHFFSATLKGEFVRCGGSPLLPPTASFRTYSQLSAVWSFHESITTPGGTMENYQKIEKIGEGQIRLGPTCHHCAVV